MSKDGAGGEKPLRKISEAFKDLAAGLNSSSNPVDVQLEPFSRACSLVSPLFGCLGIAFKFAEMDYVAKVADLAEASKSIGTLQAMVDSDIEGGSVRKAGSHTRNLLRVKRGIDMVRLLFEQIIQTEGNSLKDPASTAYAKVFAPYHGWAIRKAVSAGMYALPSKTQLLNKLNEDEASAKMEMQNYVAASTAVVIATAEDNSFIAKHQQVELETTSWGNPDISSYLSRSMKEEYVRKLT